MENSNPQETKSKKLKPIWIVTITIIGIALLMGFGALYYNYRKAKEKTYIENPKVGDVYEMEVEDGFYSTAKVLTVRNDSVFVTYNNMKTDKTEGISEIDIDRNYGLFKGAYSKKKLESLFAQDSIFAINRD
ncbi:MAG: hypothetical protein ACOVQC_01695 [Flavobacterium sp.]